MQSNAVEPHITWNPVWDEPARRWSAIAADLAASLFSPRAAEVDRSGEYPWEHVRALAGAGLTALLIPARFGGHDESLTTLCAVAEAIARGCPSTCTIWSSYAVGAMPLVLAGTEEQQQRWLPDIAAGAAAAFALTEEHAGSDASAITTSARPATGGGWQVQGEKWLVGNGGSARYYTVFAKAEGIAGLTAFLLDKEADGLVVDRYQDKMGLRGTTTSNLRVDCVVPGDRLIGHPGRGLSLGLSTLNIGRVIAAAQSCAMAETALQAAAMHATDRQAFGSPIIDFQAVGFRLADVATELSAARMMTWEAAGSRDDPERFRTLSAMAKLYSSEVAHRAVDAAVQVLGAAGYAKPNVVERLYRDQRVMEIFEGTSEIQRLSLVRTIKAACAAARQPA
ncbi:MAG: acyl-CoA dehydrogenase [Pseudonocardia sp. SCN 72-86]|nr:MAG: acyl-CoA dehydrogenase [Pseudonocardia sp. SCN 72-86]